ncbi:SMP-30/gluconolactonase/LRE family protein [Streptomyces sp. NPDC057611]|uniref:SMP-30/gluconolactonase/LRE family protein n=1 Tax=Streptomyces sp. NPDC057611 TaxID=3346182 RepID=UPI0036B15997
MAGTGESAQDGSLDTSASPLDASAPRRRPLSRRSLIGRMGAMAAGVSGAALLDPADASAATGGAGKEGARGKSRKPAVTVLATGLKFPEGPVALPNGDVLVVEVLRGTLTRIKPNGAVSVVAELGGGPNGAALGPDGRVYVANNGGLVGFEVGAFTFAGGTPAGYVTGSIQVIDLTDGTVRTLYTECAGQQLRGPNDLVFDAHGGFYFTDYGKTGTNAVDRGRLFYATADGTSIRLVASGMDGPNGIGLSPDGKRLYVSETYTARVWWWEVTAPGEIKGGRSLAGSGGGNFLYTASDYTNFDSLGVEAGGNVCVASMIHAGISVVRPDGRLLKFVDIDIDDDPGITNICWGGEGLRTAYITASSTGKLLKVHWPRPGLALNHGPHGRTNKAAGKNSGGETR